MSGEDVSECRDSSIAVISATSPNPATAKRKSNALKSIRAAYPSPNPNN